MHRKKILFVIGQLTHGGAEKQLLLLAENINKDQFDFRVICLSEDHHPYGDLLKKRGVSVKYIKRKSRFDIMRVLSLIILFYQIKPDVIISSLAEGNIYCYLSRLFYFQKNKYIAQIRSAPNHISGLTKLLNILAYKSAKLIIINSKFLTQFTTNFLRQDSRKIKVISNGIRSNLKFNSRIFKKYFNIGIIGKDTRVKNIDLFIESSLSVLKKYPNMKIHLCGRGLGKNNRFSELIKEYKSNFVFYGELDDVNELYRILDIFVLCSRSEGLPNVILESMSYGIPIVSTAVGGVNEIITHRENGMLVESGDKNMLSHYIIEIIEDETLRNKLSMNSIKLIQEKYSINEMVSSFEKIFHT